MNIIRWSVLSVVGASVTLAPALAVPVVPNFTQGSMTSHTETTQTITETINSMDYNTGYQYSATGTGVYMHLETFHQEQVLQM